MKTISVLLISVLVGAPAFAMAGNITTFQGGTTDEVAWLTGPAYTEYINLSIPADGIIMGASVDISSVIPDVANPGCPRLVQVSLNDTPIWGFSGPGYGALGRQDTFFIDALEKKFWFGEDGGTGNSSIRLMKDAVVKNATLEVNCDGAGSLSRLGWIEPPRLSDLFSFSVADAGDVNGDGFDDIIIGQPFNDSNGKNSGRAYVFYGGASTIHSADVILSGESNLSFFGASVSGAGDVNGDGYDDVIVGATHCADLQPYNDVSKAYIYYGGASMDSLPDVFLDGEENSSFGISVSAAGDVNGDGYADVVVGSYNTTSQYGKGKAYVYFGGQNMGNSSDVVLTGPTTGDGFGHVVSGAGDVNNDTYDDVIVGAYTGYMLSSRNPTGFGAYLFLGGKNMDGAADLTFKGNEFDILGVSVSGAGDVNGDGYDDMVIGAPGVDSKRGAAYIYCGGARLDSGPEFVFNGSNANDLFGASVSDAGDVNANGLADVVITANGFTSAYGTDAGAAYMFYGGEVMQWNRDMFYYGFHQSDGNFFTGSSVGDVNGDGHDEVLLGSPVNDVCALFVHGGDGLDRPDIQVGGKGVWTKTGYFNGTETTLPFPMVLQGYLDSKPPSIKDEYGNAYVDVPASLSAKGGGRIILGKLNITYEYKASISNFTEPLKNYMDAHRSEQDANGNITVPIKIVSATPGRVKLLNLKIVLDEAPTLKAPIPDLRLAEDSRNDALLDLYFHFKDDYAALNELRFCVTALTNASIVNVSISNGHFLSADSLTASLSENWTGEVKAVVECLDTRNLSRISNEFSITVFNVNDPPVIISQAPPPGFTAEDYEARLAAVDGDGDSIGFSLTKGPPGMVINSTTGQILWPSPAKGAYELSVRVSDGQANSSRNYIITVENRPIWISNETIPDALTGARYTYRIPAVSETGKELIYRQVGSVAGMDVGAFTGLLEWTPDHVGNYSVSINISDGNYFLIYDFTIHVGRGNRPPKLVSQPVLSAVRSLGYSYQARATDEDGDALNFKLVSPPAGMTINSSIGMLEWNPGVTGTFNVTITVSDGRGGEDIQKYALHVGEYVPASVEILEPDKGQTVKGRMAISGRVARGTLDVRSVQIRIDSGDWVDAEGNSTWKIGVDTTKLSDGGHRLSVRAFDGNGYSDAVTRDFNVKNAGTDYSLWAIVVIITVVAVAVLIAVRRKGRAAKAPAEAVKAEALPPEGGGQF